VLESGPRRLPEHHCGAAQERRRGPGAGDSATAEELPLSFRVSPRNSSGIPGHG
jgi:hypothetical protein